MKKLLCFMFAIMISVSLLTGCSTIQDKISDVVGGDKEKVTVARGTWADDIYSNEYMDISFAQPEGWDHSTDEQIADLFSLGSSALTEEGTFDYDLEKEQNIYDMFCMEPLSGDSITIMYEKMFVDVTMEEYLNIVKEQIAPEDPNDDMNVVDEGTVTIAGAEYNFFEIEYISTGARQTYVIRQIDDHMTVILITDASPDETSKATILGYFSALK